MFEFKHKCGHLEVIVQDHRSDLTLSETLELFKQLLLAAGYHPDCVERVSISD